MHNKNNSNKIFIKGMVAMAIILFVLIVDQIIKIEVKTSMMLGESVRITDWFYILFIENNGMAWGMTFVNKLFLSLLRIVAVSAIAYYIYKVVQRNGRFVYIACLSLVLAGAAGNIIDSLFYGLCFTASTPYSVAYAVPFGTGYTDVLMGKVVDMFYFPLFHATWPSWLPLIGGDSFTFFSPVFNFADASITTGVISLILFCSKDLATLSHGTTDSNDSKKTNGTETSDDSDRSDSTEKL